MEHKIGINLTLFSLVYVIALFLELIFNREFLAGVIPIGMIANTPVVERAFSIMFVIGAVAFGMVLIMQPILLGSAAYIGKLNRPGKILLWTSLYLSILLDLVHVIYGVNNTSFDPPALFFFGLRPYINISDVVYHNLLEKMDFTVAFDTRFSSIRDSHWELAYPDHEFFGVR
ncbi:hypothetical protein [Metallosphaera hakonensis]|uniref:hypothetical protein n=1 Tax=Metallosphaera hakonensis TaxID=79601 RepID=UPI0006D2408F|nr:hypothetical protein [Metallosphaera hakonensis]